MSAATEVLGATGSSISGTRDAGYVREDAPMSIASPQVKSERVFTSVELACGGISRGEVLSRSHVLPLSATEGKNRHPRCSSGLADRYKVPSINANGHLTSSINAVLETEFSHFKKDFVHLCLSAINLQRSCSSSSKTRWDGSELRS